MFQVIGAATQCALSTSQLVACAKVVAPTISDPMCQEQLVEAAREVAKSVEGCVARCNDVSRDDHSLRELGQSAADVTRALNELLNHVKDGHLDKIPDIMEQIMSAQQELEEFRLSANSFNLRPMPGESLESAMLLLNNASKSVGSTVAHFMTAAFEGNADITNRAARDTSNALRDYTSAVRGVAASTKDQHIQNRLLDQAQLVMAKSAQLVLQAQRAMQNPTDPRKQEKLVGARKDINMVLSGTLSCLPGQQDVDDRLRDIGDRASKVDSSTFLSSAKTVAANLSAPNARNNLATAARGVTESINDLINVYTSAAPGQNECDNAVRAIQSSRHILEDASQPVSGASYYECLDIVMEKSEELGSCMTGIANWAPKPAWSHFGSC